VLDPGSRRAHKPISRRDAVDGSERLSFLRRAIAIDLGGIEDSRCARDTAFAVIARPPDWGRLELLVEDDKARLLVFADLGTDLKPLLPSARAGRFVMQASENLHTNRPEQLQQDVTSIRRLMYSQSGLEM
jgi:hypothetical protein